MKLMSLYESILKEKTFSIDLDVDLIYRFGGFKQFIDEFDAGKFPYKASILNGRDVEFAQFDSSKLKTPQCKRAHLTNPVTIWCGLSMDSGHSNYYNTNGKLIHLSPEVQILQYAYGILPKYNLTTNQEKLITNGVSEHYMKIVIEHELSHWLDDTMHNFHIRKDTDKSYAAKRDMRLHGERDINTTQFEIDAQVHGLKALKASMSDREWNTITTEELFYMYPSLHAINQILINRYDEDESVKWQKKLLTRMAREGLLGRRMKTFAKEVD